MTNQFNPADFLIWIDLDDTLWDFRANSHEALLELYDHLNLSRFWPISSDWLDHYHCVNDELWGRYAHAEIDRATLRHQRFFRPFTEAGMDADEADKLVPEADRYYLERLGVRGRLVSGGRELVDRLKASGFRLGILSNGFKEVQYNKLRSSGLTDLFDVIVLSDEIDVNKPDERIYRYAEQKGNTTASRSVMIGDNPDTDIFGALRAGWSAIWFNPSERPSSTLAQLPDPTRRRLQSVASLNEINFRFIENLVDKG